MRIPRASSRKSVHRTTPLLSLKGFTIVELLIVIVVIAILAAITIVAYNGIQTRARASQASTALSQAKRKLELYKVDNSSYPTTANLASAGIADADTDYQYTSDGTTYCLTATAVTVSYFLNSTTQSTPTAGGCAGHGQGGVAAITNLALVPRATQASTEWQSRYAMTANYINGAVDGPDASITTYYRLTQGAPLTGTGRGVDHHGNVDLGTPNVDLTWPVTAGETVAVSVYTRASLTNTNLRLLYRIHNGASGWLTGTQQFGPSVNYSSANTWVRMTGTFVASVSGYIDLSTRYETSTTWTTGATIDATGLMVVKSASVYGYADPVINSSWVWNGSANASTSTGPPA